MLAGLAGIALAAGCGTNASAANSTASTAGAGRGAGAPAAGPPSGTISEAGSSLLLPLMEKWATTYHQQVPGVTVQTAGGGSTAGIDDASAGSKDIGASDAYLSSGDLLKNPDLLNIPLAVSAQSVIFNLPGLQGEHINLTGTVLAEMYSGTITTWNDPQIQALNLSIHNLPATRVVPLHRVEGSGDTFIFTSYLSTQDPAWNSAVGYGTLVKWPAPASAQTVVGSAGVISTCARTAGCVGYNGISYLAQEEHLNLGEAALQNGGGHFTTPDADSGAAIRAELYKFVAITPPSETISMIAGPGGDGYPIINFEYAVVSLKQPSAATARLIRDFLTWVVSNSSATSLVAAVAFQPLPPDIQALSLAQIARIQ